MATLTQVKVGTGLGSSSAIAVILATSPIRVAFIFLLQQKVLKAKFRKKKGEKIQKK